MLMRNFGLPSAIPPITQGFWPLLESREFHNVPQMITHKITKTRPRGWNSSFFHTSSATHFQPTHASMAKDDFYEILGVNKRATEKDIKKAYYLRAKEFHPDTNDTPEAQKKFQEITQAYTILKDPVKRKLYDVAGDPDVASKGSKGETLTEDELAMKEFLNLNEDVIKHMFGKLDKKEIEELFYEFSLFLGKKRNPNKVPGQFRIPRNGYLVEGSESFFSGDGSYSFSFSKLKDGETDLAFAIFEGGKNEITFIDEDLDCFGLVVPTEKGLDILTAEREVVLQLQYTESNFQFTDPKTEKVVASCKYSSHAFHYSASDGSHLGKAYHKFLLVRDRFILSTTKKAEQFNPIIFLLPPILRATRSTIVSWFSLKSLIRGLLQAFLWIRNRYRIRYPNTSTSKENDIPFRPDQGPPPGYRNQYQENQQKN